jgi:6-phosphogluconate dehydrogenase
MKLGYIGLGKMGYNMVDRLLEKGHEVVVFDKDPDMVEKIVSQGAVGKISLVDVINSLEKPRLLWIMVPHEVVGELLEEVEPYLEKGDTVIDGGNSYYQDSQKHSEYLAKHGISFLDVGVSGGPSGARNGACVMVGGEKDLFSTFEPIFHDIAAEDAYQYVGPTGAGHFVKMVHNGIEYGMMQSLAEGFTILKSSPFKLNLAVVAKLYNHKSVIESRLIEWLHQAYEKHGSELQNISGSAEQSGEGKWTVKTAWDLGIPARVIDESVEFRIDSKKNPSYTGKIISALRNEFGGHSVEEPKK